MATSRDPNVYSCHQQLVYLTLTTQEPKGKLPARIKVMPTELGKTKLNAFWSYWLRRMLLAAHYRPAMAVELHGSYAIVSGDADVDRLWDRVRVQAERIKPLEPALKRLESPTRHRLEWRVPTPDSYKAISSALPGQLKGLPPSVKVVFLPPFGPGAYSALLRAENTKPGTKVHMAEVRQLVELEAALLYAA